MRTPSDHPTEDREVPDDGRALLDAADAIADMAQRVQLNGPEITYASEKLGHALYKAAEALALCEVELEEMVEEVRRGHQHGRWLREDGAMLAGRPADEFAVYPVSSEEVRLWVIGGNGSVVVRARRAGTTVTVRLTANEARVLANVLNSTAKRVEA